MYCPTCEGEYRKGILTCPTCEVTLVESLDDAPEPRAGAPSQKHVSLTYELVGYTDEHEARDARRMLREARIPCELVIRDALGPAGTDPGKEPADEFWIRISGTNAAEAAEILKLDTSIEDACPSCGAPVEGEDQADCTRCGHHLE